MIFDNEAACRFWLDALAAADGADLLLGDDYARVVEMARIYAEGDACPALDYGAEMQLAGESGIDLSVQYALSDFVRANPLAHPLVRPAGDFLLRYTDELAAKDFPHLVDSTYAYLEADTSRGEADAVAMFLNLSGTASQEMLPFILREQGQPERLAAVSAALQEGQAELAPWYFGFMHSRKELPLRLAFYVRESAGVAGMLAALKRFGPEPGEAAAQLQALDALGLFTYMLDIDILPDGSVGDTWGVELVPRALLPQQQKRMLGGEAFAQLAALLRQWGMADERVELLPRCFWSTDYTDRCSGRYVMYSYLSHLKLRWKKEKAYPAKVYIQLREIPRQKSINESLGN